MNNANITMLNPKMTKMKIIDIEKVNNYVVYNFSIRSNLEP
jgi:hypothetical protein